MTNNKKSHLHINNKVISIDRFLTQRQSQIAVFAALSQSDFASSNCIKHVSAFIYILGKTVEFQEFSFTFSVGYQATYASANYM